MKQAKFGDWLQQSLLFINKKPGAWLGYTLFIAVVLLLGRISPALGIFSGVVCLFVGVGVAKYIDLYFSDSPVEFFWAVRQSLPLAIIFAVAIVLCWFIFMAIANIVSGEYYKIVLFFFNWDVVPDDLMHRSVHDIASWLYGYADVALIFTVLMLATFGSWFSYPLMLFSNHSWSEAKAQGDWMTAKDQGAIYRMLGFILISALFCSGLTPLLTPVLYMLVSTLMYLSYKDRLASAHIHRQ